MRIPRGSVWAGAIVAVALADLWVAVRPPLDSASVEEAMAGVAERIRRVSKPGDILVHSPLFSAGALALLGDLRATPHVPAAKLMKTRRVVVLDLRAQPMFMGSGVEPKEVIDLGEILELRIYEPQGSFDVALYSLRDSLLPATMRIERPAGTITSRCTARRDEGGFSCPGEAEWLYAQSRTLRIDGEDTQCVWAHPTTDGVIIFEIPPQTPAPEGRRLHLTVSGALTDDAVKMTPDGATVTTTIHQAGKERGRVVVANRIGWVKTTVNLEPNQAAELRITTPRDGRRHHCINAEITDVAAAAKPQETP